MTHTLHTHPAGGVYTPTMSISHQLRIEVQPVERNSVMMFVLSQHLGSLELRLNLLQCLALSLWHLLGNIGSACQRHHAKEDVHLYGATGGARGQADARLVSGAQARSPGTVHA